MPAREIPPGSYEGVIIKATRLARYNRYSIHIDVKYGPKFPGGSGEAARVPVLRTKRRYNLGQTITIRIDSHNQVTADE